MALVADYDSSDAESNYDENETTDSKIELKPQIKQTKVDNSKENLDSLISDDEDEDDWMARSENNESATSYGANFFSNLPSTSGLLDEVKANNEFIDTEEDLSSIPKAKEVEKASAPLKPKKRKGPVKIVLPSLNSFNNDLEAPEAKKTRIQASTKGSALLSMLPAPKNSVPSKEPAGPSAPASKMLVPHSVSRKKTQPKPVKKVPVPGSDSESDDEGGSGPFFTLEAEKIDPRLAETIPTTSKSITKTISATPDVPELHPQPVVGPSKPTVDMIGMAYPEAEDLMANSDALERLAGKNAFRNKKDNMDIVEVKGAELAPDPREWLTKAMTEDDPDKPGPRCMIKGKSKQKHQITYLAALAKENEHKLKDQWAQSANNRRAAGAKYGFF